jgi:hypothetical protein
MTSFIDQRSVSRTIEADFTMPGGDVVNEFENCFMVRFEKAGRND